MVKHLPSPAQRLDLILELLTIRLQLTKTQAGQAEDHYGAVGRWLLHETSPIRKYDPDVYPHGSLRIGTTVRPLKRCDFDLDLICRMLVPFGTPPERVYWLIFDRLASHGTYKKIIEPMPRCIRINYAEESQFHLDVVPAVPDQERGGTYLLIPEKGARLDRHEKGVWRRSNPKGYADWFFAESGRGVRLAKMSASIEPLPRPEPALHVAPLKIVTQLFKRGRDVEYADRTDVQPSSIILTTLAGQHYRGETLLGDAMMTVLDSVLAWAVRGNSYLENPANRGECISEKWQENPGTFADFVRWVTRFRNRWAELRAMTSIAEITRTLSELFGEGAEQAVKEAYSPESTAREKGLLGVTRDSRTLLTVPSPAVVPVRRNTFYGDESR